LPRYNSDIILILKKMWPLPTASFFGWQNKSLILQWHQALSPPPKVKGLTQWD